MYVRDTLTHPAKGLSPSAHPFFSSLLGAGIGIAIGMPIGAAMGNIGVGLAFCLPVGAGVGLAIGAVLPAQWKQ